MIQITERIMSTKELVVQMATAFFPLGPHFRGLFTPLYFAKIATALAFSNSPDFYLSKYVKMSKWPKSASRHFWELSDDIAGIVHKDISKANLILKSFQSRDRTLLTTAFCTHVRPLLEYCSSVLSPPLHCK